MEKRNNNTDSLVPASVSFRQLAAMLGKAPVEAEQQGELPTAATAEREAFERLLAEWSRSGQRLLAALGNGGPATTEGRSPRQLIALGALQAHLALALQAHAGASGPNPD
ncbi:hypothetical protein [Cyanobium gracile]|uniref:Uncharacterized protein n=1 Tax=Cyanobium gracile (strain ATCC 27147 / PCC 6307) TaxID=292564 RepID=K9P9U6_CYAGP|nr:hypothetical protein [Cyanobium gracile]AFY30167.1 hypothetical protein Cyagr_3086 [Cyanobium gracile PCC 6307]